MSKIIVAFWSKAGNTKSMENAIGRGIKAAGKEAEVLSVSAVSTDEQKQAEVFALGKQLASMI